MSTRRTLAALAAAALTGVLVAGCSSDSPSAAPAPQQAVATTAPATLAPPVVATPVGTPAASPHRVPPEKQDVTFQAALQRRNLAIADSPSMTIQYGHVLCSHLDANEPLQQLASEVQSTAQVDADNAGYVIGAAAAVYCPDDLSKLPTG